MALEIASFRSIPWTRGLRTVRNARNTIRLARGVSLNEGIEIQTKDGYVIDQQTVRVLRRIVYPIRRSSG
jgi:hypothetical protein